MKSARWNCLTETESRDASAQAFAITEPQDGQKISSLSIIAPQSSQSPATDIVSGSALAAGSSSKPPQ
jgi:hypothetical protein